MSLWQRLQALRVAHKCTHELRRVRACREVGDAIPLPVEQLKGVFAAVRGSMGANVPQSAEVCRVAA